MVAVNRNGAASTHCRNLRQEAKESIVESREVHIKHLLDTGAVDRIGTVRTTTGAKILSRKFVDDAHKEKSRWCARVCHVQGPLCVCSSIGC